MKTNISFDIFLNYIVLNVFTGMGGGRVIQGAWLLQVRSFVSIFNLGDER